jgi:hypothetical protein
MAEIARRKAPARHLSGDSFESMFHQKSAGSDSSSSGESSDGRLNLLLTQVPQAGSRRGGKRGGKKGAANLGDFVEEMNSSSRAGVSFDPCEQTVDSRDITSPKFKGDSPKRHPVRRTRSGRKPIKEENDEEQECVPPPFA